MHEVITCLFWSLVEPDFFPNLRCVSSADKKEADHLSRANGDECVRLTWSTFDFVWKKWGGFYMDLMATTTLSQRIPEGFPGAGDQLPFIHDTTRRQTLE